MSSFVYPVLSGLAYGNTRTPIWKTGVKVAVSGKESRIGYMRYPLVRFSLVYEILRDDQAVSDLKAIVGLFNAMQGQFDTFLYIDPSFNSATTENFGTGDGTTTQFQLVVRYQNTGGPGYAERIQNLNGTPQIFDNGVLKTGGGVHYTLGPTGIITWVTAPTAGHALTWTGSFYYRCRFTTDTLDNLDQILTKWWELTEIDFQSIAL